MLLVLLERDAALLLEEPGQVPIAQREAAGQLAVRQLARRLPGQEILHGMDGRMVMVAVAQLHIERRILAQPAERHDVLARDLDRGGGTERLPDQVQGKVDARRHAGRGHQRAIFDQHPVGQHPGVRMALLQPRQVFMVGRAVAPIEQARRAKQECAGADAGQRHLAKAGPHHGLEPVDDLPVLRRGQRAEHQLETHHDHHVARRQPCRQRLHPAQGKALKACQRLQRPDAVQRQRRDPERRHRAEHLHRPAKIQHMHLRRQYKEDALHRCPCSSFFDGMIFTMPVIFPNCVAISPSLVWQ